MADEGRYIFKVVCGRTTITSGVFYRVSSPRAGGNQLSTMDASRGTFFRMPTVADALRYVHVECRACSCQLLEETPTCTVLCVCIILEFCGYFF